MINIYLIPPGAVIIGSVSQVKCLADLLIAVIIIKLQYRKSLARKITVQRVFRSDHIVKIHVDSREDIFSGYLEQFKCFHRR